MLHAVRTAFALLTVATLVAGCARAGDERPGGPVDARPRDAALGDGPRHDAPTDGRLIDAPAIDAPVDAPASNLDPDLEVPPASNPVCSTPGSLSDAECPGIQVCRFYSTTEGRCDSCGPCGNLNASCNDSDECDILFMCFQGRCTNFCTLGTFECGPPEDCVDIGHPTRGVCQP